MNNTVFIKTGTYLEGTKGSFILNWKYCKELIVKLIIEIARVIRVGFLQQNAFHDVDTFVPLEKQYEMIRTILYLYRQCQKIIANQIPISQITELGLFDKAVQLKYQIPNDDLSGFGAFRKEIDDALTKFNIA